MSTNFTSVIPDATRERERNQRELDRWDLELLQRRKSKFPRKTAAFGGMMILGGFILAMVGLSWWPLDRGRATAFFVISGIMVLPASYSAFILIKAYRKKSPNEYDPDMPSLDHEDSFFT